jgi:hypothetical protein
MKITSLTALSAIAVLSACDGPETPLGPDVSHPGLSVSASAAADATPIVAYSNFGPGMSFNPDVQLAFTINGFIDPQVGEQVISQRFTPPTDGRFHSANVAVTLAFGPPSIRVLLHADANGQPGQILEDIPLQGLQPFPSVATGPSTLRTPLRAGTPYWLTVDANAAGVIGVWHRNSIGQIAADDIALTGTGNPLGPWSPGFSGPLRAAFQINLTPLTAREAVQSLMEQLSALIATGALTLAEGKALQAKLSAAVESLERDNIRAACGQIGAFVNQIDALVNSARLPSAQAGQLLDGARQASSQASCDSHRR